ncbi:sulfite exporter TauE/SafE family protein [Sporosarcina sp. Sa2YVA2]|uniref:Probable membrane transporter protein n=1 Tax=Sporosarcina quadrami TaxID=2762234 RepID=A0ABR8U7S6_9BACL|nr:sulfite exporter TauE/SafE family protein [Sporosarcina quadrami]MBD7984100.1 sulfite exporter TauE/SafE family protein [Sporosarcina quadrami]
MEDLIILVLIVLVASFLQTSTGYGFSIIGTPFLLLIYPAHTAIQVNIILSICLSAFMIFKVRNEVDKSLLFKLIKGSIAGLLFGIFLYLFLDIRLLKMTVGALILILTILLILKLTIKRTSNRDFLTGGISGLLTTSIGVPGPPLLLYFSGAKIDKTTLRSTTLAYYLFVYFASLVMQISFGGTTKETWISSLLAIPPLFAGIMLGQLFFKWISQITFRIITYMILIFTGIYLLATSF